MSSRGCFFFLREGERLALLSRRLFLRFSEGETLLSFVFFDLRVGGGERLALLFFSFECTSGETGRFFLDGLLCLFFSLTGLRSRFFEERSGLTDEFSASELSPTSLSLDSSRRLFRFRIGLDFVVFFLDFFSFDLRPLLSSSSSSTSSSLLAACDCLCCFRFVFDFFFSPCELSSLRDRFLARRFESFCLDRDLLKKSQKTQ